LPFCPKLLIILATRAAVELTKVQDPIPNIGKKPSNGKMLRSSAGIPNKVKLNLLSCGNFHHMDDGWNFLLLLQRKLLICLTLKKKTLQISLLYGEIL
jgi:hypothetical protein